MMDRSRAQGMWRAVRNGLAQLNRRLAEAGSSDEDLVFHVRHRRSESSLPDRKPEASRLPKP